MIEKHKLSNNQTTHEPIPRMALRNRPPHENKQHNTNSEPNHANQNPKWFPDTLGIPKNACVNSARGFRHFRTRHETTPRNHPPTSTLAGTNSMSNKFSQTPRANQKHQHISKNKLTGACKAGGKPSTWFPPGGLAECLQACKMTDTKLEKQSLTSATRTDLNAHAIQTTQNKCARTQPQKK